MNLRLRWSLLIVEMGPWFQSQEMFSGRAEVGHRQAGLSCVLAQAEVGCRQVTGLSLPADYK